MNLMEKIFIFDLDGTIIDAYDAIVESMNYTLQRLNYPAADALLITRSVGAGNDGLMRAFFREPDVPTAREVYRQHHKTHLTGRIRLLPGALDLLQSLKKQRKILAVASNRPADTALLLLETLEITGLFDRILTGEEVPRPKPAPDILLALLREFRCLPEEALYFGDMTIDGKTGAAAGVKTVLVATGSSTRQEIEAERPFLVIGSLPEFPAAYQAASGKNPARRR